MYISPQKGTGKNEFRYRRLGLKKYDTLATTSINSSIIEMSYWLDFMEENLYSGLV